jgi:hypothetical protein
VARLPLALPPADRNASLEISVNPCQMADEPALLQPDLISDSVVTKVMALAPRQRRERLFVNTNSATKLGDLMKARYRSVAGREARS